MTASIVGARYAKALIETVLARGSSLAPDEAIRQIRIVEDMIAGSPELRAILMTPAVLTAKKRAVVGGLAERSGVSPLIRNFVSVVLDHKRISQLTEIREAFEVLLDQHLGVVRAHVTSAMPLDDAQSKAIEAELARVSGKRVRMETAVDPDLLGGVMARVGSTVYDGSVRGQLEAMRRKLTSESADYKAGI